MNKVLAKLVRHRIIVAGVASMLIFLAINVIFFIAPDELTYKTSVAGSGVSVEVSGGPTVDAVLSSPLTVFILFLATVAIISWLIYANRAKKELNKK